MSKELEALKRMHRRAMKCQQNTNIQETSDYIKLEKALTPPTQEEVCEALSEYLGEEIIYIGYDFINEDRTKIVVQLNLKNKNIEIYAELPAHLIILIGKFYEKESEAHK